MSAYERFCSDDTWQMEQMFPIYIPVLKVFAVINYHLLFSGTAAYRQILGELSIKSKNVQSSSDIIFLSIPCLDMDLFKVSKHDAVVKSERISR